MVNEIQVGSMEDSLERTWIRTVCLDILDNKRDDATQVKLNGGRGLIKRSKYLKLLSPRVLNLLSMFVLYQINSNNVSLMILYRTLIELSKLS